MLDIKKIIENKEIFSEGLSNRGYDVSNLDTLLELDTKRRNYISDGDDKRSKRNEISKKIGQEKRKPTSEESLFIKNLSGESLPLLKFNQGKIKITSDGYWDGRVIIEIANEVVDRLESDKKRYFKRNNEFSSVTVILQGDSKDLKLSFEPIIGK